MMDSSQVTSTRVTSAQRQSQAANVNQSPLDSSLECMFPPSAGRELVCNWAEYTESWGTSLEATPRSNVSFSTIKQIELF